MRLICPNCGAQYEVDAAMIPAAGRDVQCSNCSTTWFQHPQSDPAPAPQTSDPEDEASLPPPPVRARETPPEVLAIIREEAEREAKLRQAEALETQEEMTLEDPDDPVTRGRIAREQIADLVRPDRETAPDPVDTPDPDPEPMPDDGVEPAGTRTRRGLLPDIEEINSTLKPDEDDSILIDGVPMTPEAVAVRSDRRGRRFGFFTVLLIAVAVALAYAFAPEIAARVPQAAPYLDAFVVWVNALREQINLGIDGLSAQMSALTAS